MRKTALIALVALSMGLTGCAGIAGKGASEAGSAILGNLEHCKRDYRGSLGLTGNLTVTIECPAKPYALEVGATVAQ